MPIPPRECLPEGGVHYEMGLLEHQHLPNDSNLRDILSKAKNALMELKPCWMMSPLAVAQYMRNKNFVSLVIIDEASQMEPPCPWALL